MSLKTESAQMKERTPYPNETTTRIGLDEMQRRLQRALVEKAVKDQSARLMAEDLALAEGALPAGWEVLKDA